MRKIAPRISDTRSIVISEIIRLSRTNILAYEIG